jgi:hypothetical protein
VSRLKRFKAPGSATPPKTAELSQTLTGVSAIGNLYLKVTGAGVVPVGGSCQAQAAAVQAPAPLLSLVVKDANGAVVGVPGTRHDSPVSLEVFFPGVSVVYGGITTSGFLERDVLMFTSSDCTGPALTARLADSVLPTLGVCRPALQKVYGAGLPTGAFAHNSGSYLAVSSALPGHTPHTALSCSTAGGTFLPPSECCFSGGTGFPVNVAQSIDAPAFVEPLTLAVQ